VYVPNFEQWLEGGEDERIKVELATNWSDDRLVPRLDSLLEFVRGAPLKPLPESSPRDNLFIRQIGALARIVDSNGRLRTGMRFPPVQTADAKFDFLDSDCEAAWSITKLLNFLVISRIKPTRLAAVVATMRDDGVSMLEFIAHYITLGFDHIFIFSNDNSDGTTEMLELLSELGVITFIENEVSIDISPQRKAFEYSIHFLPQLRDYEWVFYADSDEFLLPAPKYDFNIARIIEAVNESFPAERPSAICYSWKWFGGQSFRREEGLQLAKFEYSRRSIPVKSLVCLADVLTMRPLHFPICKRPVVFVDSALAPVSAAELNKRQLTYEGGKINHYWNKSFEEFAAKKLRGDSLEMSEGRNNEYKRVFDQFFAWNVPARPQYYDPCPQSVISMVSSTREKLFELTGVRVLHREILKRFDDLLRPIGGPDGARRIFEELALQYPDLTFEGH